MEHLKYGFNTILNPYFKYPPTDMVNTLHIVRPQKNIIETLMSDGEETRRKRKRKTRRFKYVV